MIVFEKERFRKKLRTLGEKTILPREAGKTEKFAENANFFGLRCKKIASRDHGYVCLPAGVEVFNKEGYLFPGEGVFSMVMGQGKIYPTDEDLFVFGMGEGDVCFFDEDKEAYDGYYAYLALYSAYLAETDRKVRSRQKRCLSEGTTEDILRELSQKTNKEKSSFIRNVKMLPPLYGFPEDVIKYLLSGVGEVVCFPCGGVWQGLFPVLADYGVKKIILPRDGSEPFFVRVGDKRIDVHFEDVMKSERRQLLELLSGYRGYPQICDAPLDPPQKEGVISAELAPAVILPQQKEEISPDGDGEGLIAGKEGVFSGVLSVYEKEGTFFIQERGVKLFLARENGRRCGVVAERNYISGRFAVSEAHCYYRAETARLRVMLGKDEDAVYTDYEGQGAFVLAVQTNDRVTDVECALPFGVQKISARNGVFRARDEIALITEKSKIRIKYPGIACKKEGETFYVLLPGNKLSFIITD